MPSLLSISRGAKPSSSSLILQRHRLIQTNTPLLDVTSCHLRRYSHLGTVDNLNNHVRHCSAAILNQKWNNNTSVACLMMCRHLSAAAIMNDSSPITNYSNKQKHSKSDNVSKESSKNKKVVNWRAWFRSSDYDDPWSAYRPLTHPTQTQPSSKANVTNLSNNSMASSPTVVENVLSNYTEWERRRHGLNLPPLTLHSHSLDVVDSKSSTADDSPTTSNNQNNNNNTSNNTHNQTNSNNKQITQLQKRTKWIDKQTRFTIQLLNDLHTTGIRRQMDRPTTERCHRMIGRLLGLTPREGNLVNVMLDGDGADSSGGGVVEIRGAAQRAKAILERMEWCSPVYLPHLKQLEREEMRQMFSRSGSGGLESLLLSNHSPSPPLEESDREEEVGMSSSLERYRDKVPNHLLQTKQVIPSPTRAIYNMVLLLYGKERGSRHVAEQAEDIVWGMIVRGLQLEEFQMSHTVELLKKVNADEESSFVPIYPTTQNWNCVLNCWSKSRDPNRAFFAYSFFKSWMEWNVTRSKLNDEEKVACCDLETFQLMIKCCVVDELAVFDEDDADGDDSTTTTNKTLTTQRAKEVGSRVAIGIWKDLRAWKDYSTENTLSSETYHELLIALCQLSNEPSRGSLAAVAAVFQSCRSDGVETKEITSIIRGVMTEAQYQKLMSM